MYNLENLKEIRKDSFEKQEEIAKFLDIKPFTYAKYEQGKSIPSLEIVFNFSKHYNLNVDYVLGTEDKRTDSNYKNYDKYLISNNLKALRLNKGLSQRGLAMKLKITQAGIQRYESSLSNPSLATIYKYQKYFSFTINDLCTKDFNKLFKIKNKNQ